MIFIPFETRPETRLCGGIEIPSLSGYRHDITRHGYNNERPVLAVEMYQLSGTFPATLSC